MAYQMQNEGETCNKCNSAKIVKNPRTGKTFCEDKCWLKGSQQAQPQQDNKGVDWDAKDRLSQSQTALNCTASIYQGKGDDVSDEKIKARFNLFYDLLRQGKAGLVARPEQVIDVNDDVNVGDIPF